MPPGFVVPQLLRTAVHQLLQRFVQGMDVAGRMVVEDDEVEREAFEPQILVRLQELDDERRRILAGDADEQNRKIPGDTVLPQLALASSVLLDGVPVAQPRVAREQAAPEALKRDRVLDGQVEVPQLDLAVRARQRQRACHRAAIVVLLDQVQRGFFALGIRGREREPRGRPGRAGGATAGG